MPSILLSVERKFQTPLSNILVIEDLHLSNWNFWKSQELSFFKSPFDIPKSLI
jgi:hypothetical protein